MAPLRRETEIPVVWQAGVLSLSRLCDVLHILERKAA
jgi:hypothetical protein